LAWLWLYLGIWVGGETLMFSENTRDLITILTLVVGFAGAIITMIVIQVKLSPEMMLGIVNSLLIVILFVAFLFQYSSSKTTRKSKK
jgi:hypothetical protein